MIVKIPPTRRSQIGRLLRALASAPAPPKWSGRRAFIPGPPRMWIYDCQAFKAMRAGWIEPSDRGWRLTATGRVVLKALERLG